MRVERGDVVLVNYPFIAHGDSLSMQPTFDDLYRAFEPYRLGGDFTGCDHCVSPTDSQRLATIPLRELIVTDVDRYAFKAMTTWGTVCHFKYFLPRLMELAFDDYLAFGFPEVLLGKLAYADWMSWPEIEQDAVRQFLDTFWRHQLNSSGNFPTDERIQTVLGGLAAARSSIVPYLQLWRQQPHLLPAMHLAQLVNDVSDDIMTKGTVDLWGNPPTQCAELVNWLPSQTPSFILDALRETITVTFPFVFSQLDGIRTAVSTEYAGEPNPAREPN